MIVMNEWQTLYHLLNTRCSIARYGDGEIRIVLGGAAVSQKGSKELQKRMADILVSNDKNVAIGIPRLWDKDSKKSPKWWFWEKYSQGKYVDIYDSKKQYYSQFITRPDSVPEINCARYWDMIKMLWDGRHVVVVEGEQAKSFVKEKSLLANAQSVTLYLTATNNAFEQYQRILDDCLKFPEDSIYLLAVGATATVLAYDLGVAGRQALDLGHLPMFYRRFLTGNETTR